MNEISGAMWHPNGGVQCVISSLLLGYQAQEGDWLETRGTSTCNGKGTHGE